MLQGESHILHIQSWITIQVKAGFSEEKPFSTNLAETGNCEIFSECIV